jgi:hypothetical protein
MHELPPTSATGVSHEEPATTVGQRIVAFCEVKVPTAKWLFVTPLQLALLEQVIYPGGDMAVSEAIYGEYVFVWRDPATGRLCFPAEATVPE